MDIQKFVKRHLLRKSWLSWLLSPLSLIYAQVLLLRRWGWRWLPRYRPPILTISIGNITAGGAGKTPFTIFLAQMLAEKGWQPAVSTRGYKSGMDNEVTILAAGEENITSAENLGDEAWLYRKRLPQIPLVIGKSRQRAIQELCHRYPEVDCIILDDSFQHLKVRHDYDIVLINQNIGLGNGFVLPAGYLREPVSALKDADEIILTSSIAAPGDSLKVKLRAYSRSGEFLQGKLTPENLYDFHFRSLGLEYLKNLRIVLVSGIAHPKSFEHTVRELGGDIVKHWSFADHYAFADAAEVERMLYSLEQYGAEYLLVTEKDFAKLHKYGCLEGKILALAVKFEPQKPEYLYQRLALKKEKLLLKNG